MRLNLELQKKKFNLSNLRAKDWIESDQYGKKLKELKTESININTSKEIAEIDLSAIREVEKEAENEAAGTDAKLDRSLDIQTVTCFLR